MSAGLPWPPPEALWPQLAAVALCAARLLPVVFLCPLLGGPALPGVVRWGVVLALALHLRGAAGVAAPGGAPLALAVWALREAALGTVMGLVATLPFDAARIGGRLVDLVRGTSAEASLPGLGTREAASGELLHQLLVGLAVTGGALPLVVAALLRSFRVLPLGAFVPGEALALQVATLVGGALATGLAVGAPVVAAVLGVDCVLGLAARAAPQLNLQEVGAPVRILAGGALLWATAGALAGRLLVGVEGLEGTLTHLLEGSR